MRYLIGVDIGTSGTKTVLFDEYGNKIRSKTVEYPMYQPKNGWAEQDPELWWNAVCETLKQVTAGIDASEIKGVGLTNGIETYKSSNANGKVVDLIENVTIDASETGMWISADFGTVKNCTINGDVSGIKLHVRYAGNTPAIALNDIIESAEVEYVAPDELETSNIITEIAAPATILQVYFATFTAYGLTVYNFKLKNLAWSFIMAIMMIPAQVSIIGFMNFMMKINLYDTYWPLIIPAMAAPSTVYFMKQYMTGALSVEIIEAARIDGSGEFATFNKIALPLMKPAMATQAIFAFIASWNNLYTPSMMITNNRKYTLPMFVQGLRSDVIRTDYGFVYVGLTLTVLPLLIVYFAFSKYIIAGVALGGVKE